MTHRNSSDPYFLLGLFLEYDDQPARAEKFFQKASDLAGISGGHIAVFLAPAEAPAPAAFAPAPARLAQRLAQLPRVRLAHHRLRAGRHSDQHGDGDLGGCAPLRVRCRLTPNHRLLIPEIGPPGLEPGTKGL